MTRPKQTERDRLVALHIGPPGPELTCEECFEQLDRYVDLRLNNARPDDEIPGMRAHLEGWKTTRAFWPSWLSIARVTTDPTFSAATR
jgi:hypothetical protein